MLTPSPVLAIPEPELRICTVGAMATNCYLLTNPTTRETIIIDPGDDAEYLSNTLVASECTPVAILLTHGHFDHVMAAPFLCAWFGIPLWGPEADQFLLARASSTQSRFTGNSDGARITLDETYGEDAALSLGGITLNIFHTPGHTPGSVCLYNTAVRAAFVGDLMFAHGGVGRTDFSYCSKHDLQASITHIRASLPPDTLCFAGHGASFILEEWLHEPEYE